MEYKSLTGILHNSYKAAQRYVAMVTTAATLLATTPTYGSDAVREPKPTATITNTPPYGVTLTIDKQVYLPGEKVTFTLTAKDKEGNMVQYILRPKGNETTQPVEQLFNPTSNLETTVAYQASQLPLGVNDKTYTAMVRVVDKTRVGDKDVLDQGTASVEYKVVREQAKPEAEEKPGAVPAPEPAQPLVTGSVLAPVPAPEPEPVVAAPAEPACSDDAVKQFAETYIDNLYVRIDGKQVSVTRRDLEKVLGEGSVLYTPSLHQAPDEFKDRNLELTWLFTAPHTTFEVTAGDGSTTEVIEPDQYVVKDSKGEIYAQIAGLNCDKHREVFASETVKYDLNRDEKKKKAAAVVGLVLGGLAHAFAIGMGAYCRETGNCQPQGDDDDDDDTPAAGQGGVTDDGSLIE